MLQKERDCFCLDSFGREPAVVCRSASPCELTRPGAPHSIRSKHGTANRFGGYPKAKLNRRPCDRHDVGLMTSSGAFA